MKAEIVQLPKILDPRGNLTFFQNENQIPFIIQRVFWIYDVPGGDKRGGHAYKTQSEIIIALSGSFDVKIHDGKSEKIFSLNRSYYGLLVHPMAWRQMENFSTNALAFVASDARYNAEDYIRDFEQFKQMSNV